MDRSLLVFLALSICIAQCATIRGKDKPNKPQRYKRYCHYCGGGSNGPVYHSQQYSGLARSDDGSQGVFSGAAAAANFAQSVPTYSVASSVANAGADAASNNARKDTGTAYGIGAAMGTSGALASGPESGLGAIGDGAYSGARAASQTAYNGARFNERSDYFGGQQPINNEGGPSSENKFSGSGRGPSFGENKFSGSGRYKEYFSSHSDNDDGSNGAHNFGSQPSRSGYGGNEQQVQQSAFERGHGGRHDIGLLKEDGQQQLQSSDHGQWQQSNEFSGPRRGSYYGAGPGARSGSGRTYHQRAFNGGSGEHNYGYRDSKPEFSGLTNGGRSEAVSGASTGAETSGQTGIGSGYVAREAASLVGGLQSSVNDGSQQESDDSSSSGPTGRTGHTGLTGALNLASQGLHAAQEMGCSTCGRNSYAFSKAKSKSGDAVAISIGG